MRTRNMRRKERKGIKIKGVLDELSEWERKREEKMRR